jgi:cytochrome oxidase Cu insertion factor (SCO1/SenC/PrrC family)
MSVSEAQALRRSRIQLLLIFGLFLIPPVGAWITWQYLGDHGVEATTNAGTLVSPAQPVRVKGLLTADGGQFDDAGLRGRWTYVMFAQQGCDDRCQQQLYLTRQVRMAMNKDVRRVQRLLVLGSLPDAALVQRLAAEHSDLRWVVQDAAGDRFADQFQGAGFSSSGVQYFLLDPLGNLMMFYDLSTPAKGMMKDLQKLLKISQIG